MKLQPKPPRNNYDTPESRQLVIQYKKQYDKQAYWELIKALISASYKRNLKQTQIILQAVKILYSEGYNKYQRKT